MADSRLVPIFEDDSDDYEQVFNAEALSPGNDMIVDSEDLLNDAEAEKDDGDIAIINPEDEPVFRADDCMRFLPSKMHHWLTYLVVEGMKELVLPLLPEQPPIIEDKVHTWAIENWRDHPRRDHGPIFEAGGHPWYATFKIEESFEGCLLLTSVGVFFSFPTVIMSITSLSTSSMHIRKETPQMILPAVYNLG
jgi:hypothetical protein